MENIEYDVILTPQAEGGFTVSVPEPPDVVAEGETREEAVTNARDAIEGYIAIMQSMVGHQSADCISG